MFSGEMSTRDGKKLNMSMEEFRALSENMIPLMEQIQEVLKEYGTEDTASFFIKADGYAHFGFAALSAYEIGRLSPTEPYTYHWDYKEVRVEPEAAGKPEEREDA